MFPPTFVEPFNLVEPIENQAPPIVTMADNRTMAQLLEAPTEDYEDAIIVPEITADNFELKHVERETKVTKDTVPLTINESTKDVQPPVVQVQPHVPNFEPVVAPVSAPKTNPKPSIMYPSRRNDESRLKKAIDKLKNSKALIGTNKKLFELARTLLNEHCSAVLLKKLPEKLGDPGKFLIPCDFPGMDECLALADLGASINLMPLSVWKKLSLPKLTPTCMTLELADRSISQPIGIAEDVYVKVGKYSSNYDDNLVNRFDVIDMACEEYSQEVLGFFDVIASGNPTPYYDPIVSTPSPTLTPFGDSDFLLEEVDAFLALEDDPTSPEVDHSYYNLEGDILLLEAFLNDDPSLPHPTQGMLDEYPGDDEVEQDDDVRREELRRNLIDKIPTS
ncbi:reverse transcriptase domain-containing protein [Tanacetum coccineum]